MDEKIQGPTPQQGPGTTGTRPPKGWIPPLGAVLQQIGVYNNETGYWVGLPLQALTEALLAAESLHTQDKIDSRNKKDLTVESGTEADVEKTAELEVPSGEVWYINRFNLATPAEVLGNIRISKFPAVDGTPKGYLATNQAVSTTTNYDLAAVGELGADLRLVGGDKLVVVAKVHSGGATTADRTVTLIPYGRKARRLV